MVLGACSLAGCIEMDLAWNQPKPTAVTRDPKPAPVVEVAPEYITADNAAEKADMLQRELDAELQGEALAPVEAGGHKK
jgi:hypothetical protein